MRTTIISTSKLKTNKIVGFAFMISFFAVMMATSPVQVLSGEFNFRVSSVVSPDFYRI
jgi:hypothetical protein